MPDQPILIFPAATVAARQKLGSRFPPRGPRPTQAQQRKRLGARFRALGRKFGTVRADTGGIDPEQVIVLETVGSVGNFQSAVRRIPDMEWLGDFDAEIAEPDPGFLADGTSNDQLSGRLFVIATNRSAFNELLALWRAWTVASDEKLPRGFGSLAEVFKHLQDVRPWGPKDRIRATGIVEAWQKELASNEPTIRFEAELWCRADPTLRAAAYSRLESIVSEAGGQCITQKAIRAIDYHGVLIELPASAVRDTVDAINAGDDNKLLRLVDVKYFAPMPKATILTSLEGTPEQLPTSPSPVNEPVVGLLDGLPLTNHHVLQGRLRLDDPDNLSAQYQPNEQRHGTSMASLITCGELEANEIPLASTVYVRPIMVPGRPDLSGQRWETFPANELPIDLIHRAVRRMFEQVGDTPPTAPTVKVVNLSVGDAAQLFDRQLSPWARLLDWLSWKYKILFVVSAGNHLQSLVLPIPAASISSLSDQDLRGHTMRAIAHQRVERRLIAPAESINALTVGASHAQAATPGPAGRLIDLFRSGALPAPFNPVASGFRRAIKPEILVPGGMRHYAPSIQTSSTGNAQFEISNATGQPGQLVAFPGGTAVPPDGVARTSGTSNAAALTTRRSAQFADQVAELREEPGGDQLSESRLAVILKAMLTHGASWGDLEEFIDQIFDGPDDGMERWWRIKRACAQFLGYGLSDFVRGTVCTDQRVILLGTNELRADDAHVYRVPLPSALHAQTVRRRLTVTLAWLTPVNPRHRDYKVAELWFDPPQTNLRVTRRECDHNAVNRGTIQHEVLEGDSAVPISDGDTIPIQVNCRSAAGISSFSPIPYCLMVSLETAAPLAISVYEQVRISLERIRSAARIRPVLRPRP